MGAAAIAKEVCAGTPHGAAENGLRCTHWSLGARPVAAVGRRSSRSCYAACTRIFASGYRACEMVRASYRQSKLAAWTLADPHVSGLADGCQCSLRGRTGYPDTPARSHFIEC